MVNATESVASIVRSGEPRDNSYAKKQPSNQMSPTTIIPTAVMDLSNVRKTEDGKVSVIDVISQIKKCSANYAAQAYQRLLGEERVPTCEVRNIAQRTSEGSTARCSRPSTSTPIATAAEIIEVIWQLPGAVDFRKNCAKVCVRYLGGDESLVEEVRMNRRLQDQLQEEAPSHPARIFGEAVEQQHMEYSEAVKRKREELEIKRLDAEISELEFSTKRRRVQNYVDCYSSLQTHGIHMDDRNKIAIKDYVDTTMQPSQVNVIQDTPVKELCIRTFLLQYTKDPKTVESTFGKQVAKLKREQLIQEGKTPEIPKKQIYANGQTVNANLYFETDRNLFEQAWAAMRP